MSFLNSIKEAGDKASKSISKGLSESKVRRDEVNQRLAVQKETNNNVLGELLVNVPITYMGGYNNFAKSNGKLSFYKKCTLFAGGSANFTITNDSITRIAVEGKDEANRRVTVTRLFALGIFAFALKKKSKDQESYVTLELSDGQEVVFFKDNMPPMQLKVKLSNAISQVKQASVSSQANTASGALTGVADELGKLALLRDQGVITADEFDAKKRKLLDI